MKKLVLALAVVATACITHTMARAMDSWLGQRDTDLVSEWGAPTRTVTLSDSSRVMTWVSVRNGQACEQSFTISQSGVVKSWATNNCPRW